MDGSMNSFCSCLSALSDAYTGTFSLPIYVHNARAQRDAGPWC